ncbi:MAG TPA: hypothetical protein VN745_00655 [Verrucomicrobiae bacterium]|nr:hypothetical protein [Verrucomicrobiae bacterium]
MKSLRAALSESHISAIAVAVLLFLFFDFLVRALLGPLSAGIMFLITAIAIRGMPYFPERAAMYRELQLIATFYFLFEAAVSLAFAWLLSKWTYDAAPVTILKRYRPILSRRNNV